MKRAWSFINGAGGVFILAVVIFGLAVVGHVPLPLALAMSGIMVAYGLILLVGRRWDPIAVLSAPGEDERAASAHTRAAATAGQAGVSASRITFRLAFTAVQAATIGLVWVSLSNVALLSSL